MNDHRIPSDRRIRNTFLLLVMVQGVHSVEEYLGRLWESFPPAAMLCGLISENLETGFLVINIGLFVFGMLCWIGLDRLGSAVAPVLIWFWIVLEFINSIGHPIWSLMQWSYTPGVATAPVLLIVAIMLTRQMLTSTR